jgi:hypothetical protein
MNYNPFVGRNKMEYKYGIKSITSGNLLPSRKLEESKIRKFFGLPHVKMETQITSLSRGETTSIGWYRPVEIHNL